MVYNEYFRSPNTRWDDIKLRKEGELEAGKKKAIESFKKAHSKRRKKK